MGSFTFIEHTADLAVQVTGSNFSDLLKTAADAFRFLIIGKIKIQASEEKIFSVSAITQEEILVYLLSELNYLAMEKRFFVDTIESVSIFKSGDQTSLKCTLFGVTDIKQEIEIKEEIKAVTFHQMEIKEINNGLTTMIVFDI